MIEQAYREFLLQSHDPEEREYPDAADQIREVLIHGNYLSQKDIQLCLGYDLAALKTDEHHSGMEELHRILHKTYGDAESSVATP